MDKVTGVFELHLYGSNVPAAGSSMLTADQSRKHPIGDGLQSAGTLAGTRILAHKQQNLHKQESGMTCKLA